MSYDIFISYSSKDKIIADAVVAALEKNNMRCWYAPRDIRPGTDWGEAITQAIEDNALMLLIFSKNANRSRRVLDEIYYAILKEKTILPFRIENLDPSGAMLLHLSSRHWLDAYDPSWETHINKLVKTAATTLGREVVLSDEEIQAPTQSIEPPSKAVHRKSMPWKLIGIILAIVIIIASVIGIIWKSDDIAQALAGPTTTASKTSIDIPPTAKATISHTTAVALLPTVTTTIKPTPTPHPGQVFGEP
ncbi:MAG: toll/interleukin-1 receptor domain-containing protein, partial [Anaerolineaceae bacterium]|nr:toll/interleukin-1 receptor domain-containing protein [Anaerolineaceae bacterium]